MVPEVRDLFLYQTKVSSANSPELLPCTTVREVARIIDLLRQTRLGGAQRDASYSVSRGSVKHA